LFARLADRRHVFVISPAAVQAKSSTAARHVAALEAVHNCLGVNKSARRFSAIAPSNDVQVCVPPSPRKTRRNRVFGCRLKRTAKVWRHIRVTNLFDMGICLEDLLCDLAVTLGVCDCRVFN
jgi:hypothetical protein